MKHYLILAGVLSAFTWASCNNETESNTGGQDTTSATNTETTVPEGQTDPAAHPTPMSVDVKQSTGGTAEGMNPEHGQPGHRCEIPVGAPLNSPASSTPPASGTPPPSPTPITVNMDGKGSGPVATPSAPPAGATAPGMNPPHGQPGHDCSVPVGAPLKK